MKSKWIVFSCILAFFIFDARLLYPYIFLLAQERVTCDIHQTIAVKKWTMRLRRAENQISQSKRLIATNSGLHLWQTSHGQFWIPAGSDDVLPLNLAEQELSIYGGPSQSAHEGDIVIDCGSNIGITVRRWISEGARKVIAIEPAPENLECLRRNLAQDIKNGTVIVIATGVWDHEDHLTLQIDSVNSAADSFVTKRQIQGSSVDVPLTTIDRIVEELGLDRVDFIKMDIEGAEKQALAGASRTLKRFKPRLSIAAEHLRDDSKLIPTTVLSLRSDYSVACGPCSYDGIIRPETMYFQ